MPHKPIPISNASSRARDADEVIDQYDSSYVPSDKGAIRIKRYNGDEEEDVVEEVDRDVGPVARDGYGGSVPSSSVGRDAVKMEDLIANAKPIAKPANLGVARDYEFISSPSSRVVALPNPTDEGGKRPGIPRKSTDDDWEHVGREDEETVSTSVPKKGYADALKGVEIDTPGK
ncbi:hypothetical protein FRC03_000247 [Tulasnella sp. 419]|nr:hypothetical protein FRC03_000247 [Tulasnella sp. 419]